MMDSPNVERMRSALSILNDARRNLDPAYRGENFPVGQVEADIMAAVALINLVLGNDSAKPLTLVRAEQTCFGCPSQWDAWDEQGNQLYLRFRYGCGTVSLRGRMVDGEMEWLDREEEIATFNHEDAWAGVISLVEFAERAGIKLGGVMASWTQ